MTRTFIANEGRWRIEPIPESRGNKKGVLPLVKNGNPNNTPTTKSLKNNQIQNADLGHPQKVYSTEILTFEDLTNQQLTETGISVTQNGHHSNIVSDVNVDQNRMTETPGRNTTDCNPNEINGQNGAYLGRPVNPGATEISPIFNQENQTLTDYGISCQAKS